MSTTRILLWIGFALLACGGAYAQEELGYHPRYTTNVGTVITVPLNPASQFTNIGWGFTGGAGYDLTRNQAVVAEFLWNKLYPTGSALQPVQVAFNRAQLGAYSNLFAVTGNYRYELHGNTLGVYFIGGGGWYFRNGKITHQVAIGTGVSCDPAWTWWGYSCQSGKVTTGLGPSVYTSNALGINGGVGFTVRVGEPLYKFYIEARYHYAPTQTVNIQVVNISVGIRY